MMMTAAAAKRWVDQSMIAAQFEWRSLVAIRKVTARRKSAASQQTNRCRATRFRRRSGCIGSMPERARDRALELARVGYIALTRHATIAQFNRAASMLLGIDRKHPCDCSFAHFVLPEDRDGWRRYFVRLIDSRERQGIELRLVRGNGVAFDVRLEGIASDESQQGDTVCLTVVDISERKRLEAMLTEQKAEAEARAQALAEAERFARATIDALRSRVCVLDERGQIIATNRMWRESPPSATGGARRPPECAACLTMPHTMPCWSRDAAARVDRAIEELLAGRRDRFSIEYQCRMEPSMRWFEMHVSRFACDGPVRLVVMHDEITERKRAVQAERDGAERIKRLGAHLETLREEQSALIARELHDELGATLTMLKLGLATLADDVEQSDSARTRFSEMLGGVESALQVVKRVSSSLRPATLDTLGLVATIESYAAQFSHSTGIVTVLRLPDHVALSRIGAATVFRIIQEGLTNVARHAGASKVAIGARKCMTSGDHGGVLIVRLRDNGSGIAENEQRRHDAFGLMGMRERAQHIGGSFTIDSRPGQGTRLTLCLPLDGKAESQ